MDNKRKFQRITFRNALQYRSSGGGIASGTVGSDLSEGGIRFQALDFIPLGAQIVMEIVNEDSEVINIEGRVAWIQKVPHSETYQIGVEFDCDQSALAARARIRAFILSQGTWELH